MESDKWVELVWLEGPDARPRDWGRYLREQYPDLTGYRDEDFRIEALCGRDGVDRVRLSRRTEPTERLQERSPGAKGKTQAPRAKPAC